MFKRFLYCKVHPEAEILDLLADGDIICKECALVLSQRNYGEEVLINDKFERIGINDKELWYLSEQIKDMCDRLHLCDAVVEEAIYYLKQSTNNKELMGLPKHSLLVAAIHNSIKRNHVGLTVEEISYQCGIDKAKLNKATEILSDKLCLGIEPCPPESFLEKFGYALGLGWEMGKNREECFKETKLAIHIARRADKEDLVYLRKSEHVAAVIHYIASHITGNPIKAEDIYSICNICPQTLKSIYTELLKNINILLPDELKIYVSRLPKTIK